MMYSWYTNILLIYLNDTINYIVNRLYNPLVYTIHFCTWYKIFKFRFFFLKETLKWYVVQHSTPPCELPSSTTQPCCTSKTYKMGLSQHKWAKSIQSRPYGPVSSSVGASPIEECRSAHVILDSTRRLELCATTLVLESELPVFG